MARVAGGRKEHWWDGGGRNSAASRPPSTRAPGNMLASVLSCPVVRTRNRRKSTYINRNGTYSREPELRRREPSQHRFRVHPQVFLTPHTYHCGDYHPTCRLVYEMWSTLGRLHDTGGLSRSVLLNEGYTRAREIPQEAHFVCGNIFLHARKKDEDPR